MSTVTLNISDFRIFYPAFEDAAKYPDSLITLMFNQACAILGNSDDSIYPYDPSHGKLQRMFILYAATCHLLTLRGMAPGQTGRITSASQGSVSTSFVDADSSIQTSRNAIYEFPGLSSLWLGLSFKAPAILRKYAANCAGIRIRLYL